MSSFWREATFWMLNTCLPNWCNTCVVVCRLCKNNCMRLFSTPRKWDTFEMENRQTRSTLFVKWSTFAGGRDAVCRNFFSFTLWHVIFHSHPRMLLDSYKTKLENKEEIGEELLALVSILVAAGVGAGAGSSVGSRMSDRTSGSTGTKAGGNFGNSLVRKMPQTNSSDWVDADLSGEVLNESVGLCVILWNVGKLLVLNRMMLTLRAMKTGERIVVVSNYTQTLDIVEKLCLWDFYFCCRTICLFDICQTKQLACASFGRNRGSDQAHQARGHIQWPWKWSIRLLVVFQSGWMWYQSYWRQ